MVEQIVKWFRQQVLAVRCARLRRRMAIMRLDGELRLLEMAREN